MKTHVIERKTKKILCETYNQVIPSKGDCIHITVNEAETLFIVVERIFYYPQDSVAIVVEKY